MAQLPSNFSAGRSRTLAFVGLIGTLPALLMALVGTSIIWAPGNAVYAALDRAMADPGFKLVFNWVSMIAILAGLLLALLLNAFVVFRFSLNLEEEEYVFALRIRPQRFNLAVIVLSTILLGLLLFYVVGENWQCFAGLKTSC